MKKKDQKKFSLPEENSAYKNNTQLPLKNTLFSKGKHPFQ
jgi:hypothetical protein